MNNDRTGGFILGFVAATYIALAVILFGEPGNLMDIAEHCLRYHQ